MASAISSQGELVFHSRDSPYDTAGIIEFLKLLLEKVPEKILIVWDGASIHKSKKLKEFLAESPKAHRLHLAIQPPYSPSLNADEQVWQWIKNVALKNQCFQNFKELKLTVIKEMDSLAEKTMLLKKFFHHPEVKFY